MLKGINQWCYPEGTPLEDVLKGSQVAGFDAVELNLNSKGGIGLTMETPIAEVEQISRQIETFGLQLRSLSTSLLWQTPLSSPDEAIRDQGKKVVQKQLEFASLLGADTVLVVPGVVTPETTYEQCYERSQAALQELLPIAEQYNVKIGIENVWNKFLLSPMEMVRYIDELDSPYLGAYFDVGNVVRFGYPEQWIESLGERIFKIHVKDFSENNGFVPLLAGAVNWSKVSQALAKIGYKDTITAELTPYNEAPKQLAVDTSNQMDVIIHYAKKVEL
ncbi:hexulose-6-phosphate isomerase [Pullulanibacillus pueri]|uniref:Hexulose-6-phosphate isomerase n=1 Tax=Pullulanibacillus pueri TaxID=1437324 RepID=A0A8J2ZZV4_9BACL|nr:sugar phosphate isomerase/epimerase family protein [Pullulanibacillus pueri]MBM7683663.1 hexulose-6-phosphate isomerase [Pullulanibacillus pueri]GGH87183.1 hexulose-6-phosphate isomerase [Pullulanibacillus pueri]